jgi:hypothetical protein
MYHILCGQPGDFGTKLFNYLKLQADGHQNLHGISKYQEGMGSACEVTREMK